MLLRLSAVLVVVTASLAGAQTYTWTGAGSDGLWSTSGNWLDGHRPVASFTSVIDFTGGEYPRESINDLADGFDLGTLKLGAPMIGGGTLRVHEAVDSAPPPPFYLSFSRGLKIEFVGDVTLTSAFPAASPGSSANAVMQIGQLRGTGTATFRGGWGVIDLNVRGLVIAADASLMAHVPTPMGSTTCRAS